MRAEEPEEGPEAEEVVGPTDNSSSSPLLRTIWEKAGAIHLGKRLHGPLQRNRFRGVLRPQTEWPVLPDALLGKPEPRYPVSSVGGTAPSVVSQQEEIFVAPETFVYHQHGLRQGGMGAFITSEEFSILNGFFDEEMGPREGRSAARVESLRKTLPDAYEVNLHRTVWNILFQEDFQSPRSRARHFGGYDYGVFLLTRRAVQSRSKYVQHFFNLSSSFSPGVQKVSLDAIK